MSLGVNSPTDAPDVVQSLCRQNFDAICLPNSNLVGASFPTIAQAAQRSNVPIFGFLGSMAKQVAVVVVTRDYHDMGHDSGLIAARVMRGKKRLMRGKKRLMRGEKTSEVPLHQSRRNRLIINRTAAKAARLEIPESLLKIESSVID